MYVGRVRKGSGVADDGVTGEHVVAPTAAADDVLRVEHIAKRFGPVTALRDVNLHLRKGEVLGLLGDNGAGKSTLIKIICGFQKPDAGRMFLRRRAVRAAQRRPTRARSGSTPSTRTSRWSTSCRSSTTCSCAARASTGRCRSCANRADARGGARGARRDRRSTSRGSTCRSRACPAASARRSRSPARCTRDADILLLDEPLAAMGAKEGALILDLIARLKEEGRVSIIMVLHNYVHVLTSVRPRQPDPGRRDHARQADRGDLGRGADRDRRRGVPARAPSGPSRRRLSHGRVRSCVDRRRLRDALGARRGRARSQDGAELGSAVHEYAHGVIERDAAGLRRAPAAAVGAAGPRRLHRRPARGGAGGRRRGRHRARAGHRDRDRLHRLDAAARCSPTARRCAGCDDLRERPHAYPKLWKHHAAGGQADRINAVARERGEPWLARYGGLISSEWEFAKGLQVLEEDPEVYERMDRFVEARRLDRLAAVRARDAQHVHGRLQGHLPGRRLPVRGLPARARRALRELRLGEDRRPAGAARRARRRPDRAGRAVDRAAGGHRRRGRQRGRTRHRARRAGDRSRPDARRHGNFDLPHHER